MEAASAFLFFTGTVMVQHMLHRLKYHTTASGSVPGQADGRGPDAKPSLQPVDCFLPVPLHPRKEFMRGYNQSQLLVDGMRRNLARDPASAKDWSVWCAHPPKRAVAGWIAGAT
jgi:predicted amidophosphoribosyltransferase